MQILSLPPSTGAAWLRDGWRLVKRQPIGLSAMVVIYTFALLIVPALVPNRYLAVAVFGVLSPFATLGLMAALRDVAAARVPNPNVFLQPLRDVTVRRRLFQLGVIHSGLIFLAIVLAGFFIGAQALPEQDTAALDEVYMAERARVTAIFALFYAPVMIVMWFSPMLLAWHGLDVGKAMFGSVVACWRNKGAIFVYGLLMTLVIVGASMLTHAVLGALFASQLWPIFAAPIVVVLMTFVQASFYPMYRSIFAETGAV